MCQHPFLPKADNRLTSVAVIDGRKVDLESPEGTTIPAGVIARAEHLEYYGWSESILHRNAPSLTGLPGVTTCSLAWRSRRCSSSFFFTNPIVSLVP